MNIPKKAPDAIKVIGISHPVFSGEINNALDIHVNPNEKKPKPNQYPLANACFFVGAWCMRCKSPLIVKKRIYQW